MRWAKTRATVPGGPVARSQAAVTRPDRSGGLSRDRLLRPRWLVWPVVLWGILLVATPRLGEGAPLPPARAAEGPRGHAADDLLEDDRVRARLAELGVSRSEAAEVWARLTPAERAELSARLDELRSGGNPVAAGVAIAIIVAMVVILTLELLGRRVISRPASGASP